MKNSPIVMNLEYFIKPGWSLLLAVSLLVIGAISLPAVAVAQVVNVGSVGNLQAALTAAQNNGVGDTIMVAAGFYAVGTTLTFTAAESYPLAIIGEGAHDTTLDGGLTTGILNITNGSSIAPVTVRDISFWRGKGSGGLDPGLYVYSVSSVTVENCLFTRNNGGYAAFITVINGGVVTLTNNIFSGNYASGSSALFVQTSTGEATLTNNTFIGNRSATNNFSAIFLEALNSGDMINVYNNIVWGAYAQEASIDIISGVGSFINAFNNISRGLSISSAGTVSQGDNLLGDDPLFQTPGYWDTNGTPADQSNDFWVHGNYRPLVASPAIDSGFSTAPGLSTPDLDFDGNDRILGADVDRGAYEYDPDFPDIEVSDTAGAPGDLSIDFGSVVVGDTSSIETVTVSNNGDLPLIIGTVVAPSAPFIMSDSCSNESLAAGANCDIDVQFIPAAEGSFSSTLSIPSNDLDTPLVVVSLAGTGTTVPTPDISVFPGFNDFNDVSIGDTSTPLVVTISSVGSGDLNISDISLTTGTDYSLDVIAGGTSPCGSTSLTVTPGGSCTVSVIFSPLSVGMITDALRINSDALFRPTTPVSLTGYGVSPDILVSPRTLDYGHQVLGGIGPSKTVAISNAGSNDLTVSNMLLNDNTFGDSFSFAIDPWDIINAGQTRNIAIRFSPEFAGSITGTLTIIFDDPNVPQVNVSLVGEGYSPSSNSSDGCSISAMSEPEEGITIGLLEFLLLFALVILWRRGKRFQDRIK